MIIIDILDAIGRVQHLQPGVVVVVPSCDNVIDSLKYTLVGSKITEELKYRTKNQPKFGVT